VRSATASSVQSDIDRTTIRIHSRQKWPEAITIDTSVPTITPPAELADAAPSSAAVNLPRDAYASIALAPSKTPDKTKPKFKTASSRFPARESRRRHFASYQPRDLPRDLRDGTPAGW
jgi:hypothetical protein